MLITTTVVFCSLFGSLAAVDPVVTTPWGSIQGEERVVNTTTLHVFKGIPFAVPPLGNRRFTKPEPHPGVSGVFKATQFGSPCIQSSKFFGGNTHEGSEDCLTLNIFTPAGAKDTPVMIWIHGGGFIGGNAKMYDASPIVTQGNVIVVTIQYRLTAFGFLSTGDDVAKGNYGLWDQHLAIQWVKTNIESFGGNNNKITVFGESAGSASVSYQTIFPGSKGLYQRAIMQSGSVTSSWAHSRDPLRPALALARKVNCVPADTSDHASLLTCLRGVPADTLVDASYPLTDDPIKGFYESVFGPVTDGEFVQHDPIDLINNQTYLKSTGFKDFDIMMAVNSNEGGIMPVMLNNMDKMFNSSLSSSLNKVQNVKDRYLPASLEAYFGSSNPRAIAAEAEVYLKGRTNGTDVNPEVLMDIYSDTAFTVGVIEFARAHSRLTSATNSSGRTFMYVFDQVPSFLPRTTYGVQHAEDVYYTFGLSDAIGDMFPGLDFKPSKEDMDVSRTLIGFLTDFAKDGNPNPAVSSSLQEDWPEFTEKDEKYLLLKVPISVETRPFSSRVSLWTDTLPQIMADWTTHNALTTVNPVVHAPCGQIMGRSGVTDDWTPYHYYRGIPFAQAPVGDLRFAKPQPYPDFNNVYNASEFGPTCVQNMKFAGLETVLGSEDCLTLNVFTPTSHDDSSRLPVMVWVHGGGLVLGSARDFNPSTIVARGGVVVVTIQYRLAAFGFLSTGDDSAKGNYGLWDQNLALQWIKRNIRSFGGDENRITVFGESGGSASVAYQSLYPGSKGLFQRAITQSGSVASSWAHQRNPLKPTLLLAKKLNCLPSSGQPDHSAMIHCLRQVPYDTFARATWPLSTDPVKATSGEFLPNVDGEFVLDDPLKLINDEDLLKETGFQDLDIMISVNSNEGGTLPVTLQIIDKLFNSSTSTSLFQLHEYKERFVSNLLQLYYGAFSPKMINAVAREYNPSQGHALDEQVLLDTSADPSFVVPTVLFARAHANLTQATNTGKKTYMYLWDQTPTFLARKAKGMIHGEDVYFTFGLSPALFVALNLTVPSPAEVELSHTVIDFLSDFARDGNPCQGILSRIPGGWPEYTVSEEKYILMKTNMSLESHPYKSRIDLWTRTLPRELEHWLQHHQTTPDPRPDVIGYPSPAGNLYKSNVLLSLCLSVICILFYL